MNGGFSGWLQVDLEHDGQRIVTTDIRLERQTDRLSRLLQGQLPEQALAIIGALFSICGHAHQVAGSRALEQARRLAVDERCEQQRERLIATERIRESLLRLMQDWRYPGGTDAVVREGLRQSRHLLQLLRSRDGVSDNEEIRRVCAGLQRWWHKVKVGVESEARWLEERLHQWTGVELGPGVSALEPNITSPLNAALENERQGEFCRSPHIEGECRHTGPAVGAESLRLATEVLAGSLSGLLSQLEQSLESLIEPAAFMPNASSGCEEVGYGWAQTARGWLLHRVVLKSERVGCWQILAPTDWNFHTKGVLQRRLNGTAIEPERAEVLARELILSIDPCVGFGVTVHHA